MRAQLKSLIRPLIPERIHRLWRRHRFAQEQRAAQGRPLAQVFEDIYESDAWAKADGGRRYSSGPGSTVEMARGYEDFVVAFLERDPTIATFIDIGCGDFQVGERILARLNRPVRYVGCDIAANVIAYNQANFARDGVSFQTLDVTRDPLPAGDIVTIREVFQHLSNDAILAALANVRKSFRLAIVTEATLAQIKRPNVDLVSGYRTRDGHESAVCLDLPPFNQKVREQHVLAYRGDYFLKTMVIEL